MKVLLDYQTFTNQNFGGVSRFFCSLMEKYKEHNLVDFDLAVKYSNNFYLQDSDIMKVKKFLPGIEFKGKGKLQGFFNQILTVKKLQSRGYDLFHPTYFNPYFLEHLNGIPFVLTVHDMIHEKFPGEFLKSDTTAERKKILIYKAKKIIAVSKNTKKDILEYFRDIPEDRIEVIHLANSLNPKEKPDVRTDVPQRYLLVVGHRYHYKNCLFMIESISQLLREDDSLFLICAGGGDFIEYERNLFESLKIKEKVLFYNADNETLTYLYQNALAFILPSLYEGFGIPVLEAMDCGCPAILSNTSSLPEVGGAAAVYFDPRDAADIKQSVKSVIYNEDVRRSMIEKGHEQAGKFSWDNTAINTADIYKSIV